MRRRRRRRRRRMRRMRRGIMRRTSTRLHHQPLEEV